jgi:hypothetical protein
MDKIQGPPKWRFTPAKVALHKSQTVHICKGAMKLAGRTHGLALPARMAIAGEQGIAKNFALDARSRGAS